MPLISVVGRRSLSSRLLLAGIYALLALGAVTMVYPFALMMSSATTSQADAEEFRLIPTFWWDRYALFKKYLVDAAPVEELAVWFGHDDWFSARDIQPDQLREWCQIHTEAQRTSVANDWREFLTTECPDEFRLPMFQAKLPLFKNDGSPVELRIEYIGWLKARYRSIDQVNARYNDNLADWNELVISPEQLNRMPAEDARTEDWRAFVTQLDADRAGVLNIDAEVYRLALAIFGNRQQLEKQLGLKTKGMTSLTYDDLADVSVSVKDRFLRDHAPFRFVRIDPALAQKPWEAFLEARRMDKTLLLTERMPVDTWRAAAWAAFAQKACPLTALSIVRPEAHWWTFLKRKYNSDITSLNRAYGTCYAAYDQVRIAPILALVQYHAFERKHDVLWWKYVTYNYSTVLKFVAIHGDAAKVTVVYVALLIVTTLTVNPLAAYAMSRFRLEETRYLLVFLLAPMAFPAEVLMIPSFLMIKAFPLLHVVVVALCVLLFLFLHRWLGRTMPLFPSLCIAFAASALSGWLLACMAAQQQWHTSVSLMNTFWALILPSLANGFGIFLLKAFFDSLPNELHEAALIDGAGELRMFWQIALPLCKPILAVMALGAFTAGYGSFMHAFLVCQDPKMWTLMVFLYEFQQSHGIPLIMASLVIAAIPTLVVFIFCQNIILRGIVIPSFK